MPRRRPGRSLIRALVLLALASLVSLARGQASLRVDFGWDSQIAPGSWNPVRIRLDAGDRILAGTVRLRLDQTLSQRAVIDVPVVTTPGEGAMVELPVCFGRSVEEVRVTFTEAGRLIPSIDQTYERVALTGLPLGFTLATDEVLVGIVAGDSRAGEATGGGVLPSSQVLRAVEALWNDAGPSLEYDQAPTPEQQAALALASIRLAMVPPSRLPSDWISYDALDALVLHASDAPAISDRARAAIRDWVSAGGRLLVVADTGNPAWRDLLPVPAEAPRVGEPRPLTAEGRLAQLLGAAPDSPALATARPLSPAAGPGWTSVWPSDSGAVFALGPNAFGLVGVLGANPARLPAAYSVEGVAPFWADAMLEISRDVFSHRAGAHAQPTWYLDQTDDPRLRSVPRAFDSSSLSPGGTGAILAMLALVALLTLTLALLVGVFDLIVLRRRSRQGWWAGSCLLWTVLAGTIAYAAPLAFRSGQTRFERSSCDDYLAPSIAPVGPNGAPPPSPSAWGSGALLAFFAHAGSHAILEPDDRAWWASGESSLDAQPFPQRRARAGTSIAFNVARTCVPSRLRGRVWTLQTLADQRPLAPGPVARVIRRPTGGGEAGVLDLDVEVRGLGARPRSGAIDLSFGSFQLDVMPGEEGEEFVRLHVSDDPAGGRWAALAREQAYPPDLRNLTMLPGAWERTPAIQARVSTGAWAAVCLELSGDAGGPGIDRAEPRRRRVVRILAPIEEATE